MENIYAFYLDTYFLNSFLINFIIYILTCKLSRIYISGYLKKIILVTFLSCICEVVVLLLWHSFVAYRVVSSLIIIPALSNVLCKNKGLRPAVRVYLLSLIVTFIVGGLVYAMPEAGGVYIVAALAIGGFLITYLGRQRGRLNNIYQVRVNDGDWIMALYDSGNRLTNRSDGRGISIVSGEILDMASCSYYGEAEYETISDSNGRLKIYEISNMVIRQGRKNIVLGKSLVGVSEKCFENKMYKIILNENVFDN